MQEGEEYHEVCAVESMARAISCSMHLLPRVAEASVPKSIDVIGEYTPSNHIDIGLLWFCCRFRFSCLPKSLDVSGRFTTAAQKR
jgi:hypothetical protein